MLLCVDSIILAMNKAVFASLEPQVKKVVGKRFKTPTKIQELVIPTILKGHNTLIISETGSGKTESVMLPVFDLFVKKDYNPISILYITPLRSLNRDLMNRIQWWSNQLEFDATVRHGDTTQYERTMQSANPSDMFITTPETLQAMLTGKVMREHLKNVKWIIIDEIHELVDSKRGVQLSVGLERLKALIKSAEKKEPQIIGLSATVGSPDKVAGFLTAGKECKIVNTARERKVKLHVESPTPTKEDVKISEDMIVGPEVTARLRRISELIKNKKSVLAFTNTRESSEILSSRMSIFDASIPMETHHSSLSKEVRIKSEEDFKKGKTKILFCTSSLELGIDIGSIDFILQYTSPRQVNKLLQRIGRSGHKITETPEGVILSADAGDSFESTAIADHALKHKIEATKVYEKALDVLGHQIIGMTLEMYDIPMDKVYHTIKKAYPFRELTHEDFLEACLFLEKLRLIYVNKKEEGKLQYGMEDLLLRRKRNSWKYYYENLSTIPNIKNYKIFDIISKRPVGTLDAEFIALHASPGSAFITKGRAWRVIDIGKAQVMVEPMSGIEASIPAWEGELIPVPFEIAQDVGKIRGEIAKSKDPRKTLKKYPIKSSVATKMINQIKRQKKWGPIPTDKNIIVEHGYHKLDDAYVPYVIINSCFGSLVNDTIGRALSTILRTKFGSVGLQTDPYRIVIKLPGPYWNQVIDELKNLTADLMKQTIEKDLPETELFRWRFLHIAKRFSIISREADYGKNYLKKILDFYANTPAYKETLNEIYQDKLDLEKAAEVLDLIKKDKMKIIIKESLSPIGSMGLKQKSELVAENRPEKEILEAFKKRVFNTRIGLICYNCGHWVGMGELDKMPKKLTCKTCGAGLISVIPFRYVHEAEKLLKKHLAGKELVGDEEKYLNHMRRTASLVIDHGFDAIIALACRGIGPSTAGRVLRKLETGDKLMRSLLDAERHYTKTRRFWKG